MIDFIFLLSATIITASYLFTDVLYLRAISMLGALGYIAGGLMMGFQMHGIKILVIFSLINLGINIVQAIRIILDRKPVFLSEEMKQLYLENFRAMTPNEFLKIYKLATTRVARPGEHLAIQNENIDTLILLKDGAVNVIKNNSIITTLESGFFIGEMSFMMGGPANATVDVINAPAQFLFWKKEDLANLEKSNFPLNMKFKQIIAVNLIKKIDHLVQKVPSRKGEVMF